MKKMKWLALLVCVVLPVSAMAVQEGVVEEAPDVDLNVSLREPRQAESYLPDASYYAGEDGWSGAWEDAETYVAPEQSEDGYFYPQTQLPRLTAGEVKRAHNLLDDYQAGRVTYTGESVLDKMEDVTVGVYRLNQEDFDGETAYVILPCTCLTDDQLLSIIAAFEEMGLTFDPAALNYRNCARGGGIETSRFMTMEERDRYTTMMQQIQRGQLMPPENLNQTLRNPRLNEQYFNGMNDFSIKPYRRMTDEELLSLLVSIGVHDESSEVDFDTLEARARNELYQAFHCPLSMSLSSVTKFSDSPVVFTKDGGRAVLYTIDQNRYDVFFDYETVDGYKAIAYATYDQETKELVSLTMVHETPAEYRVGDPASLTQETINETVAKIESELGLASLTWTTWRQNKISVNGELCIPVRALLNDHALMTIYISCSDGHVHGMEIEYGTLVVELPAEDWPDNG